MCVYLRAKFEVSSISLTSFRQRGGGGNFSPSSPNSKRTPKKPTQIFQINKLMKISTAVLSLISGHHWGKRFCPIIGSVRFLEGLAFLLSFRKFCNFMYVLEVEKDIRVTLG